MIAGDVEMAFKPNLKVNAPDNSVTQALSHELRTPITAIQVALDLLHSGKLGALSKSAQRMVEIATSNTDRLMRLTTTLEHQPPRLEGMLSPAQLEELRLETDLRSAIARNELLLHYQPIVSLATGVPSGLEALLRWQHPSLGQISPATFIPIAEAAGLISDIGAWVLHTACEQLQAWKQRSRSFADLSVSVNLSSQQLACPKLAQQVEQVLQQTGLPAKSLKLEITESGAMDNADVARASLAQIQALGVQLYIDDFGTGFSSLSRLYELPLDVLKIDRSFVQQLDSQQGNYLVRAIVSLAQNLGIDVIAEGIETAAQVAQLQALGCHRGQGYYFARPLDREAVMRLIGGH